MHTLTEVHREVGRSKVKSKEQSQEQQPWDFREQIQRGRERVLLG